MYLTAVDVWAVSYLTWSYYCFSQISFVLTTLHGTVVRQLSQTDCLTQNHRFTIFMFTLATVAHILMMDCQLGVPVLLMWMWLNARSIKVSSPPTCTQLSAVTKNAANMSSDPSVSRNNDDAYYRLALCSSSSRHLLFEYLSLCLSVTSNNPVISCDNI